MVTKEIILIIFIPIMLYFIFSSLKMISTLKSENKIGKTLQYFFIYITILFPILGWLIVKYKSQKLV